MTLTRSSKIKCDWCGAFIGYQDLADDKAYHIMTTPDAYGYEEAYESKCAKCNKTVGIKL